MGLETDLQIEVKTEEGREEERVETEEGREEETINRCGYWEICKGYEMNDQYCNQLEGFHYHIDIRGNGNGNGGCYKPRSNEQTD